jgi:hypothetical protein
VAPPPLDEPGDAAAAAPPWLPLLVQPGLVTLLALLECLATAPTEKAAVSLASSELGTGDRGGGSAIASARRMLPAPRAGAPGGE